MAVDTAAKRLSMLSFGYTGCLVIPDGSIDQGERQTLLGLYSGILFGSATIPVGVAYHWNSPYTRVFD